jgi:hypothetical protein
MPRAKIVAELMSGPSNFDLKCAASSRSVGALGDTVSRNGENALAAVRDAGGKIARLIADVHMDKINGIESPPRAGSSLCSRRMCCQFAAPCRSF